MSHHAEQATLAYSPDELFAVVADVKHYPLFAPWCSGAHIRRADEREIIAEVLIGVPAVHVSLLIIRLGG
ncbi:MAG: SRPBCC family protein [Bradyrhizobium sp.]|jgi:coenzyme Q-binding protein COQ10